MKNNHHGFGTFGGVFVPNILTILGVIMYLRLGWVVGNSGLRDTLVILLIANVITFLTAVSISVVSTNMKVKGGGVYYMISRSLGQEAGGSIGIPLFLAQAIGIGLYLVGFTESVTELFPQLNSLAVRMVTLVCLTVLALISSGIVIKVQYIILSIVGLSLISFFLGRTPNFEAIEMASSYANGESFWTVFAVFFPAVTGILSGVSMSGDLRDPSKSIPRGTLLSVGVGAFIYFAMSIWFSAASSPEEMINNRTLIIDIAKWAPFIYAGIWGATLSSALANLLAAPRTLQALAKDGIVFRFFSRGRGEQNEPVVATLVTFIIVGLVLYLGELNTIAPVLTMFFLITYGSVNIIAFVESIINRPGYRPTFKAHWIFPLLGALGCLRVMFIINLVACIAGFSFVIILYLILKRAQMNRNWGDARIGIWSAIIQYALFMLEQATYHPRNWRPNILLFTRNFSVKPTLLDMASALTARSGFISVLNFYKEKEGKEDQPDERASSMQVSFRERRMRVFQRDIPEDNGFQEYIVASEAHGLGKFTYNSVLMEWPELSTGLLGKSKETKNLMRLIRFYSERNISSLLYKPDKNSDQQNLSTLDLWWDPTQDNGSFMLLLAHLVATSSLKEKTNITIKTVVMEQKGESTRQLLEELIQKSRIKADIEVIYPKWLNRKSLEIRYNRIVKNRKRMSRLSTFLQDMLGEQERRPMPESLWSNKKQESPNEEPNIDNTQDEEETELKEQISSQLEERDAYIIKDSIQDLIIKHSAETDLVLLGYNIPAADEEGRYIERMQQLLEKLPATLLINCPFDINLFE